MMKGKRAYKKNGYPKFCSFCGTKLSTFKDYVKYDVHTGKPTVEEIKVTCPVWDGIYNYQRYGNRHDEYVWKQKVEESE